MNRRKQFRAVATRFDKLAVRYQATIAVADIFIWLRAKPDRTPGIDQEASLGEWRADDRPARNLPIREIRPSGPSLM
jgi:hypothetical protein